MMTVRTRVAPSPTGDPHVGTAYIALVNLAVARQNGGQFVLRIEDTDQVRSTAESEKAILESLRWLGLDWDEGPDVGGDHGPYRQSERSALYAAHCQKLLDTGHAFRCFCSADRLAELREAQRKAKADFGYDGRCIGLTPDEVKARLDKGEPSVVRMKVPREGRCVVQDAVRGPIEIEWRTVDMQVLLKADGLPTYHLANVVDDHLMGISHVIRGEEWISSAPKHLLLYEYFGWEPPQFVHLALLRNPDKSKLSKRKNPTSLLWYRRMGYLSEALLNYLAILTGGLTIPDGGEERISISETIEQFVLNEVSQGGPIFDLGKLDWLNARWIREGLTDEAWLARVQDWALEPERLKAIARLARSRTVKLTDLVGLTGHFFAGFLPLDADEIRKVASSDEQVLQAMHFAYEAVNAVSPWDRASLLSAFEDIARFQGLKLSKLIPPMFLVLTGRVTGPSLFDVLELMGRDIARSRLQMAVQVLGGVGKKVVKRWDKEWQTHLARE